MDSLVDVVPSVVQEDRAQPSIAHLSRLGVTASWQLPLVLPARFVSFAFPAQGLDDLAEDERRIVTITIRREPSVRWPARSARVRRPWRVLGVELPSGEPAGATIFGDTRAHAERFVVGNQVPVLASCRRDSRGAWLTVHEVLDAMWPGRIMPIYNAPARSLSTEDLRALVLDALPSQIDVAVAHLREQLLLVAPLDALMRDLGAEGWALEQLIEQCHLPVSLEHGHHALHVLRRIAALLALHEIRSQPVLEGRPWTLRSLPRRIASLPLRLTDDQHRAVDEVSEVLSQPVRARHCITGCPGSGKTIPALLIGAAICDAGGRVVLMEPTAKLASQIHGDLQRWFPDVPAALVTGDSKSSAEGARFLIGTTALLHRDLGWTPDLVIADEQHKYARTQREQLAGQSGHILEMTATPIPRTTALLNVGRIGYSRLQQAHAPKNIATRVYESESERRACFKNIEENLRAGERLLVVYPLRGDPSDPCDPSQSRDEEEERLTVSTAVRLWERWAPGRVAALTSRDDELSSQSVIDRFNEGELQIIAATTVIETGINLAQLHQMVIITPERHGLTGLHQLRGRLCREGGDGHCALVCPDPITDAQRARLGLFARTQDGFALADIDLAMRGPGDIRDLSDLQSGALHGCVYGAKLSMLDLTDAMAVLDAVSASTPPIARRRCS